MNSFFYVFCMISLNNTIKSKLLLLLLKNINMIVLTTVTCLKFNRRKKKTKSIPAILGLIHVSRQHQCPYGVTFERVPIVVQEPPALAEDPFNTDFRCGNRKEVSCGS